MSRAAKFGSCLTAATREDRSRHPVRGFYRYAQARTRAVAIIAAIIVGDVINPSI